MEKNQRKPDDRRSLMGLDGKEAWEQAVLQRALRQSRAMVDQLHVFGSKGATVINAMGSILISAP